MPFFKISTSKTLTGETKNTAIKAMHKLVAKELGKPDKFIMTAIQAEMVMHFGETDDAAAFVEFKSIGLPDTKKLAAAICDLVQQYLDLPPDRVYIEFTDEPRDKFGYNGTTFA